MGLMKQAYDTYCALEGKYAGKYLSELEEPLVPISHQIIKGEIVITLDTDGNLINAELLDKNQSAIIIPVTTESAARSSSKICAHPLTDQIAYLTPCYSAKYECYLRQLHDWERSPFSHPKLHAIARYVEKGAILEDLQQYGLIKLDSHGLPEKEKQYVCWRVESGLEDSVPECWKDSMLFQSFIDYYASKRGGAKALCMVTGDYTTAERLFPKKLIPSAANAKLISSKDESGLKYHGRFTDAQQAVTIGYEASQKAHNAIRWLAVNQGVSVGGRLFICWNPQGVEIPKVTAPFLRQSKEKLVKYSDYRKALSETLRGWKERIPADSGAVIAAFEAATAGRLSLTYYCEMMAADFLERLHDWDNSCCWWRDYSRIWSPSLEKIVEYAFGTLQMSNDRAKYVIKDIIARQHIQRLVSCRVDKAKMPRDIKCALVEKASNLQILGKCRVTKDELLFITCAVIRKYYYDRTKEEWSMALECDKKDLSYQYGRLLAVLEKLERDTYENEEKREPNAMRMQSVFAKRPLYASRIIWEQLKKAYYPRLKPGSRAFYDNLIGDIFQRISEFPECEQNRPLKDTYLFGYYLQRKELYTSSKTKKQNQEEE